MQTRVCPSCGEIDESGGAYCATPGCGARLPVETEPAQPAPSVAVASQSRASRRPLLVLGGVGVVALAALAFLLPRPTPVPEAPGDPGTPLAYPPIWIVTPSPSEQAPEATTAAPAPPPPSLARQRTTPAQNRPPTSAPPPPPPVQTQPCSALGSRGNTNNVTITDDSVPVYSGFTVSGYTGNASAMTRVHVDIKHTFRGDLVVDLVGPNGSTYRLKNADLGDSADNLNVTYTVNASAQSCSGQWRLKVQDIDAEGDFTGFIDAWSIDFS